MEAGQDQDTLKTLEVAHWLDDHLGMEVLWPGVNLGDPSGDQTRWKLSAQCRGYDDVPRDHRRIATDEFQRELITAAVQCRGDPGRLDANGDRRVRNR